MKNLKAVCRQLKKLKMNYLNNWLTICKLISKTDIMDKMVETMKHRKIIKYLKIQMNLQKSIFEVIKYICPGGRR